MKSKHPYLTDDLDKAYKYIQFGIEPYLMAEPVKPNEFYDEYSYVCEFFGNRIDISEIIDKINSLGGNPKDYTLRYTGYDYFDEWTLQKIIKKKNPEYKRLLKEYDENMVAYQEEKLLLPKIHKLWIEWSEKQTKSDKLKQYKRLKSILKKEGLIP